jgi:plasmid rolling circle replication initiator protein Rep
MSDHHTSGEVLLHPIILKGQSDGIDLCDLSPRDKPWDVHRAESDHIEKHYRGTEFNQYAERIHFCSEFLDFLLKPSEGGEMKLKLSGARFCHVRTCFVCIWRKSLRYKARVYKSMPAFINDYPSYRFLFVTLTAKNCPIKELKVYLKWMNEGFTRLSRLKAFPGQGWIKSTEVTKGKKGDAHPHFHVLMAVKSSYFGRDYLSKKKWCELWQKSLRTDYVPILDVQAVKATDSLVALIAEVVKYQTKATHLIGHGTDEDKEWFLEYTRQIMNTKAISIGGIFRDYFRELEQEPEDLIGKDEDEDGEVDEGHLYFAWKRYEKRYKLTN